MQLPVTFSVEIEDSEHVFLFGTLAAAGAELQTRRALFKQRCTLWLKDANGRETCLLGFDELAFSLEVVALLEGLRQNNGGVL